MAPASLLGALLIGSPSRESPGPAAAPSWGDPVLWRPVLLLLPALLLLLGHAVVPLDEFILRGDDAFYYFKVALNHVQFGFWTFDGLHPTNGVQPLWAIVLTGMAYVFSWVGLDDPLTFARAAVVLSALLYFAACLLLYLLLATRVSVATGFAVAGACLYPLGVVWGRLWGMESSLYLLLLVGTMAFFHWVFLARGSARSALVLGMLLGLCALGRLNAVFFAACLVPFYVVRPDSLVSLERRLRLALLVVLATGIVLGASLAWNYATTGHFLSISGAVKSLRAADARAAYPVESLRNALSMVYWAWNVGLRWLGSSRLVDGFWVLGGRAVADGALTLTTAVGMLGTVLIAPFFWIGPKAWLRRLRDRSRQISVFAYFAVFAGIDTLASMFMYPTEQYAATRWWLLPLELTLTVLAAVIVVAAVGTLLERLVPAHWQTRIVPVWLATVVVLHLGQFGRFYWDGLVDYRDWNLSWNGESLLAARWATANLPSEAVVGVWNAGVLGYFTERTVVNLDGLINNFDLIPYLREGRIEDYILREEITHLADLEPMFERVGIRDRLRLSEVYRHHSDFANADYLIYRVEGVVAAPGS